MKVKNENWGNNKSKIKKGRQFSQVKNSKIQKNKESKIEKGRQYSQGKKVGSIFK